MRQTRKTQVFVDMPHYCEMKRFRVTLMSIISKARKREIEEMLRATRPLKKLFPIDEATAAERYFAPLLEMSYFSRIIDGVNEFVQKQSDFLINVLPTTRNVGGQVFSVIEVKNELKLYYEISLDRFSEHLEIAEGLGYIINKYI